MPLKTFGLFAPSKHLAAVSLIHHEFSHVGSQDRNSWGKCKHKHFLLSKGLGHQNESSALILAKKNTCFGCAFWDSSCNNDGVTEIIIQKGKAHLQHGLKQLVCLGVWGAQSPTVTCFRLAKPANCACGWSRCFWGHTGQDGSLVTHCSPYDR